MIKDIISIVRTTINNIFSNQKKINKFKIDKIDKIGTKYRKENKIRIVMINIYFLVSKMIYHHQKCILNILMIGVVKCKLNKHNNIIKKPQKNNTITK